MFYCAIIKMVIIMKAKYILLVILIIIIIILFIVGISIYKKKSIYIKNIKSFTYSGNRGNMINANYSYIIKLNDGKYIASIKKWGEEKPIDLEISKEKLEELESILRKYKVNRWNGFEKNNKYVLDGDGFYLGIALTTGEDINASGYMMYPNNYAKVSADLDKFFLDLIDK